MEVRNMHGAKVKVVSFSNRSTARNSADWNKAGRSII
jgi:hypothetical protein